MTQKERLLEIANLELERKLAKARRIHELSVAAIYRSFRLTKWANEAEAKARDCGEESRVIAGTLGALRREARNSSEEGEEGALVIPTRAGHGWRDTLVKANSNRPGPNSLPS